MSQTPLDFSSVVPNYAPDAWLIPVLLVCYYPLTSGGWIDVRVTRDVNAPLDQIRNHVRKTTQRVIHTLEVGSTYHGYKNPAALASLRYQVIDHIEYFDPLPTWNKYANRPPMTDYNAIMDRINVRYWVEERGIKEIWLWAYHGDVVTLWESNMASHYGDISNSDRDPKDLPVLDKTYTVYHYNYQRGPSEATEDHMHQNEALFRHTDAELFWDKFVGKVGEGRCGWSHYPPNGERDYDWRNPRYVWTDIEDWHPQGGGVKTFMNCQRWNADSLTWFIYWMQNIPGRDNGLTYFGLPLTNWWTLVGDFDGAMASGFDLYG
jgi:hypothetical protein